MLDLKRRQDRVKCLLASIAIYRLFAALLSLAPAQSQRAAFYFPLARPNSTYITYFPDRETDARTVVTKEVFQPAIYFADYRLNFEDLQVCLSLFTCTETCFQDQVHEEDRDER